MSSIILLEFFIVGIEKWKQFFFVVWDFFNNLWHSMQRSEKHLLDIKNVLTHTHHLIFKTRIYILYQTRKFYWKNPLFKSAFANWFWSNFEPSISYRVQKRFLNFLQSLRNIDAPIPNSSLGHTETPWKVWRIKNKILNLYFSFGASMGSYVP